MPAAAQLVIVPAWNESGTIRQVVEGVRKCLPEADVVVIDDGSTDTTARNVPPGAKVVRLPFNLGIGGAMQTGYRYATLNGYEVAVQVDGDGQHAPEEVVKLLEPVRNNEADIVVGSRFLDSTNETYRLSFTRRAGILWLSFFLKSRRRPGNGDPASRAGHGGRQTLFLEGKRPQAQQPLEESGRLSLTTRSDRESLASPGAIASGLDPHTRKPCPRG